MNDQTTNQDISDALSANYLLVTLSISRWAARKPDKALAAEAAGLHGAAPDSVIATRKLMSGADDELKEVEKALNSIRTFLYANSLPWSTADEEGTKRGPRLVPTTRSMDLIKNLNAMRQEFLNAMAGFKAVYSQRVQQALGNQGNLADATAYPDPSELDSMFSVRIDFAPCPAVGDFTRMSIPAPLAQALGGTMAKRQSLALQNAMVDLHERIAEATANMAVQLGKHARGEKTRLYTSLVDNVRNLAQLVKENNFTNDAALDALSEKLDELTAYDIAQLKANPNLAGDVAKKAAVVGRSPLVVGRSPLVVGRSPLAVGKAAPMAAALSPAPVASVTATHAAAFAVADPNDDIFDVDNLTL